MHGILQDPPAQQADSHGCREPLVEVLTTYERTRWGYFCRVASQYCDPVGFGEIHVTSEERSSCHSPKVGLRTHSWTKYKALFDQRRAWQIDGTCNWRNIAHPLRTRWTSHRKTIQRSTMKEKREISERTLSWHTSALKPKPNSGCPWIQLYNVDHKHMQWLWSPYLMAYPP